jgi:hypothetical protein
MKNRIAFVFVWIALAQAQNITVQVDGVTKGTRNTLNLKPGNGVMQACVDSPENQRVDCTPSFNSALISTHDTVHANENYCFSSNGTPAYTCRMRYKMLTAYATGMTFLLNVDTTCATSCSLNIDGNGSVAVKMIDGTTDPRGNVIAGQPQWVFYDGVVFRLMGVVSTRDGRGDLIARRLIGSLDVMDYSTTITLDVTLGDMHKTTTVPALGNGTINATTPGLAGQHMWIIIANDPVGGKTITFGANLRSSGAFMGAPGKSATMHFISDGTAWYEVARTGNL